MLFPVRLTRRDGKGRFLCAAGMGKEDFCVPPGREDFCVPRGWERKYKGDGKCENSGH